MFWADILLPNVLQKWNWEAWLKTVNHLWSHPKSQEADLVQIEMAVIYLWQYGYIPILLYISTRLLMLWCIETRHRREHSSGFKSCLRDLLVLWSWIYYCLRQQNLSFLFYKVMIIIPSYKLGNCRSKWDNLYQVSNTMMDTS